MGSRTSHSMKSLVGKKRRGKRGGTGGGGSAIASGLDSAGETLSSSTSASHEASASGGFIIGAGGAVAIASASAAFAAPIKAAAGAFGVSKPSLDIAYHTIKYADKIYSNLPNLTLDYQKGYAEVYTKLASSPTKFPVKVAESMIIDEIADIAWSNIKSGAEAQAKMCINTTPNQDRVAKFIIGQAISLTLDMLEQKLKGKKIDKEFYYKHAIGAALEYYLDGLMQSSTDAASNPNISYNNLNPLLKKAMHTAVKEAAKEMAENIYDDLKEESSFPDKTKFKKVLKKNIEKKYNLSVDATEFEGDKGAKSKTIYATDQSKISEDTADKKILSTQASVNSKPINSQDKIWFFCENETVANALKPIHHDILNTASTLSRLEHLFRDQSRDTNIYPQETIIKSHTAIETEVASLINHLGAFLLGFHPRISLKKIEKKEPEVKEIREEADAIVLFSGGLDSIAGMEYARAKYKRIKYVFVNNQTAKVSQFVRKLKTELDLGDDLIIFQTQPGGKFLQQTRGFSFLSAAIVIADLYKAKHIIISECGVTKYQPSINVADEITKTTHPLMITLAHELFSKLSIEKEIIFPFDKKTKAEIIATVKNPVALKNSRSCRKSNISDKTKPECGHCFGCLLKHISLAYVTGEPQNQFLLDPITKKNNETALNMGHTWKFNTERYESIMSLISFCEAVIADKTCLPQTTQQLLMQQGTDSLFTRHAEDMIFGLMYMKQKGWVKNEKVLAALERIEKEQWFKKERIKTRREEIIGK